MVCDTKTKSEVLYLRKRCLFAQEKFKLALFFSLIYYFVAMIGMSFAKESAYFEWIKIILLIIPMLFWGIMLVLAVRDMVKQNKLICNGKVIMAKIDKFEIPFSFTGLYVVRCSYFDKEQGKLWQFKGSYREYMDEAWSQGHMAKEKYIPVLVDDSNYGNYYVLLRELIFSYFVRKVAYFTKVVREVNLSEIENGKEFSIFVNFN